jgi:hypothetical protein
VSAAAFSLFKKDVRYWQALSGGSRMSALTPLLEVERTFVGRDENAAFGPVADIKRAFQRAPVCRYDSSTLG